MLKTSDTIILADFILEALKLLKPTSGKTVSEWADERRILDSKTSSLPGKWKTGFTPYLRNIMDSFNDPEVEEIVVVKPTQVGGTEAILNMIGYIIDVDPSPTMVVYPTEALAESISQNRLQPMIDLVPSLKNKYDANSKRLELQFSSMYLVLAGANSPSGLSSRPCKFLFMDEVDKYPLSSGKEADPMSLARERTKTFDSDKKIVKISTPTLDSGPIWKAYLASDTIYEYFVTCPHCGGEWIFKFKQLKFDKSSPEQARTTAFYACEECGAEISDAHKSSMIRAGKWIKTKSDGKRTVAYHFNTFCSPWVRLGDIAYEFLRSKDAPELMMNFINSWLAEPYVHVDTTTTAEKLRKEHIGIYKKNEVPKETILITGGVDVQRKCFYYTVKAWRSNMTSFNIAHGKVYTWQEIEHVFNKEYFDRNGKGYIVNLCCVDSGDQTDDVYDFCAINREWTIPVKGSSGKMNDRYKLTRINKDGMANGMPLCVIDTEHYKTSLYDRFGRDEDNGGWYAYEDCDPEFFEQITAEHKVIKTVRGHLVSRWELKQSGGDNHYLDCDCYASAAADLCGIRRIMAERYRKKNKPPEPPKQVVQATNNQINNNVFGTAKGGYFR